MSTYPLVRKPMSAIVVKLSAVILSERPGMGTAIRAFLEGASHYWPLGPWEVRMVATDGDGFEIEIRTDEDMESMSSRGATGLMAALKYVEDEATQAVDRLVYR